jgi:hypothetical protein
VPLNTDIPITDVDNDLVVFTPTPNLNSAGGTTFTVNFQVKDDGGTNFGGNNTSAGNVLTFNVAAVNDRPTTASFSRTLNENQPAPLNTSYTFTEADFGFTDTNDAVAGGGPASPNFDNVLIISTPTGGELRNGNTVITGSPASPVAIPRINIQNGLVKFFPTQFLNSSKTPPTTFGFNFRVQDGGGTGSIRSQWAPITR